MPVHLLVWQEETRRPEQACAVPASRQCVCRRAAGTAQACSGLHISGDREAPGGNPLASGREFPTAPKSHDVGYELLPTLEPFRLVYDVAKILSRGKSPDVVEQGGRMPL